MRPSYLKRASSSSARTRRSASSSAGMTVMTATSTDCGLGVLAVSDTSPRTAGSDSRVGTETDKPEGARLRCRRNRGAKLEHLASLGIQCLGVNPGAWRPYSGGLTDAQALRRPEP